MNRFLGVWRRRLLFCCTTKILLYSFSFFFLVILEHQFSFCGNFSNFCFVFVKFPFKFSQFWYTDFRNGARRCHFWQLIAFRSPFSRLFILSITRFNQLFTLTSDPIGFRNRQHFHITYTHTIYFHATTAYTHKWHSLLIIYSNKNFHQISFLFFRNKII